MIRCKGCLNETVEYIHHCQHDPDVIHIRIECILCGVLNLRTLEPLKLEREKTKPLNVT